MADIAEKLDYLKTRDFWDRRAEKFPEGALMSVMLHDDIPAIAFYRDIAEKKHFYRCVKLSPGMDVLDLGCGSGRWTLDLAKRVRKITAVDFSKKLLDIAARRASAEGIGNIDFQEADLISFQTACRYDLILISGVLMYINDEDMPRILKNCAAMLKPSGVLVVREGVSWNEKKVEAETYYPEIQSQYHVVWRRAEEYARIFEPEFELKYENDAFPFMIPVIIFKRLWNARFLARGVFADLLTRLLVLQSRMDQMLLFKPLMHLYHACIARHRLAITARLYIFQKKSPGRSSFHFAGRDVACFAKDKQTPFFLFSEAKIQENYARFRAGFSDDRIPDIYYSVKTNYESAVLLAMRKLGAGAEVASHLDLYLAEKAGFAPDRIVLDGMVKEPGLLELAIGKGIKTINIDAVSELEKINEIAGRLQKKVCVGVRLDLDRGWGGWKNLIVDWKQKSFGIRIPELLAEVQKFQTGSVVLTTLMVHTTRSFPTPGDYRRMLGQMFRCADLLAKKGIVIEEFNLGGGIPEPCPGRENVLKTFAGAINREYGRLSVRHRFSPRLSFELGKSLVGNAGLLVGRVVSRKEGWVVTDISRSDYGFSFPFRRRRIVIANRYDVAPAQRVGICSNTLEKFDIIQKWARLPETACSDIVALFNVGAYSLPLSSQFTRPRSPVYFITEDGKDVLIRRRETPEDVIASQVWDNK